MMSKLISIVMLLALLLARAAAAAEPPATPARNEQQPAKQPAQPAAQEKAPATTASPAVNTQQPAARRGASDRLELDTTVVTGNRELPKVLYIVPWKKADIGDLPAQPFNTLLDEVLTPVDRDVFRREVTYYDAVATRGDGAGGTSASPSDDGSRPPVAHLVALRSRSQHRTSPKAIKPGQTGRLSGFSGICTARAACA